MYGLITNGPNTVYVPSIELRWVAIEPTRPRDLGCAAASLVDGATGQDAPVDLRTRVPSRCVEHRKRIQSDMLPENWTAASWKILV